MKGNLPITKATPEIVKAAAATAAIIIAKYLPAESRKARQRKDSTDRRGAAEPLRYFAGRAPGWMERKNDVGEEGTVARATMKG